MNVNGLFIQNEPYEYKTFYRTELTNENNQLLSQMDLVPKSDDNLESLENQNEMILDNLSNTFALTPMETEDNQADIDNLTDSMAMQVHHLFIFAQA